MTRKTVSTGISAVLAALFASGVAGQAAEPTLRDTLAKGLLAEEVNRDPEAAAKEYEAVLARFRDQQALAATALFRLAEVRRKQDQKEEAVHLYQRLLREFPQAEAERKLARENLAALGGMLPEADTTANAAAPIDEDAAELERLEKLLATSPDAARDPKQLNEAAAKNRPRVVEFLLDAGVHDPDGLALTSAAGLGHLEVVRRLLAQDDELSPATLARALEAAAKNGYLEVVRALLAVEALAGAPELPGILADAAARGHLKIVGELLAAKVDPDFQPDSCTPPHIDGPAGADRPVGTPLMEAIHRGRLDLAALLLDAKADVKAAAKGSGFTALHFAAGCKEKGAPELVGRLLDLGADPDALSLKPFRDRRPPGAEEQLGPTSPLQFAVAREAWDCARLLVKRGANVKQPGLLRPFLIAPVGKEEAAKLRFLLDNGADPDTPDQDRGTPLRTAVEQGDVELVKLLLQAGADPNLASGTLILDRSAGHDDPFTETTGKREEFPCPPLAWWDNNATTEVNFEIDRLLLEAGSKPGPYLGLLIDQVAQHDTDGKLARKLLAQRPKLVNLQALPELKRWQAEPRRVFLDEVVLPALAKEAGVSLLDSATGKWRTLATAKDGESLPPLAELLLEHQEALLPVASEQLPNSETWRQHVYLPTLTLVRRGEDGKPSRQPLDLAGEKPLPKPRAGDVLELGRQGEPTTAGADQLSALKAELDWNLRRRLSFPVTVVAEGKSRELTLRGGLLVFDPTKNEAPILPAAQLAWLFLPDPTDQWVPTAGPECLLTVERKDGSSQRMELAGEGARSFALKSGDRLILPAAEQVVRRRDKLVQVTIPGFPYSRTLGGEVDSNGNFRSGTLPTLAQALVDVYYPWRGQEEPRLAEGESVETLLARLRGRLAFDTVPVIPPHPDFSRIRILRAAKPDAGGETPAAPQAIEVDLAAAMRQCTEDTPAEEARKADLPLERGDVVELPLKEARSGEPWTGFSEEEERFFRKALSGKVVVRWRNGLIDDRALVWRQPDWKATPAGLLPLPPKQGASTMRLNQIVGATGSSDRILRGGTTYAGEPGANPFLCDGDEVIASGPSAAVPQSRPRVVPPPTLSTPPDPPRRRVVLPPNSPSR